MNSEITNIILEVVESVELPDDVIKSVTSSENSVTCTIKSKTNYDHYLYARLFMLEHLWKPNPEDLHHLHIDLSIKRGGIEFNTSVVLRLVLHEIGPSILIGITSDDDEDEFTYIVTITHELDDSE